jgi:hypothetical protein
VEPTAGLDVLKKREFLILSGLELRPLERPARSQSLYRLRYPESSGRVQNSLIYADEKTEPLSESSRSASVFRVEE